NVKFCQAYIGTVALNVVTTKAIRSSYEYLDPSCCWFSARHPCPGLPGRRRLAAEPQAAKRFIYLPAISHSIQSIAPGYWKGDAEYMAEPIAPAAASQDGPAAAPHDAPAPEEPQLQRSQQPGGEEQTVEPAQ